MKRNAEALNVCPLCIGNQVFSQFVVTHGAPGKCGFNRSHGKKKTVVSVEAFAEYVDDWFRENYGRGEEYPVFEGDSDSPTYETRGEPYKYILADELECDDAVVEAISENLPDADWHDISQGDQAFYDDTANYESFAAAQARSTADDYWYESQFTYQWDDFCRAVQYERRFFRIKEQLDELFGKPEEYSAGQTTPVYILRKGAVLYRGRILDDRFTEDQLSAAPAISLGAPPPDRATPGRMNVEFIPAFYGAFSRDTAIAEIRPSIGDRIAIGRFALHRNIKVFDFTAFSRPDRAADPTIIEHTRYDFVSQMEEEISKPILPYEKQREYVATQIVAEYLRECFKCDAVIYRSSMHTGPEIENRNIVIFGAQADFLGGGSRQLLDLLDHEIRRVNNVTFGTENDASGFLSRF
ncbi:RES domain-containing protein [Bradyrhizobium quebecense]|uniref:RES domain-containing protein n=1 Tax=Bradyrhizobium quebecense TaxID=2748629 RepID=A0A974AH98_9BRAD|nr:RES domain-containing protein [Bradyrhizobium quebecense]UGA44179.1 RES domain-containing protein [Bradyrhizobium quebecense]